MAKGLQKHQRLVFAVVTSDPEESTISDVKETSKKTAIFFTLWESRVYPISFVANSRARNFPIKKEYLRDEKEGEMLGNS
jgi:hypothetical protein